MFAHELEDDGRSQRRILTGLSTGGLAGGALGLLLGTLFGAISVVPAIVGAVLGAVVGREAALKISLDEWEPAPNRRAYVGTKSPDSDGRP
jgi:uncharacterized membrane protein